MTTYHSKGTYVTLLDRPRHRILVVDDHEGNRYATARMLKAAGYHVLEASTGGQGLELAPHASAIVLDVHLPDIDGFEVCRTLRQVASSAKLPIIHMSSVYVTLEHRTRGEEAGADVYLVQPVEPDLLVKLLDNLIVASQLPPEAPQA